MTEHHDDGDDDKALRAFADLDAWAPPRPLPAGALADAVVAQMRMRQPGYASAHELGERPPRRRPLAVAVAVAVVAGVAVAAAGVLAIVHWGTARDREPEAGRGEVLAARASHVDLGSSSSSSSAAELDPGAEVRWQREGRRISAVQPRGAALWRVDGDDTLVIDAGAAVASVEASGASLRVEVQMNRSDARVIGASAVTAVAVALVTVVVYQGHAKVTSPGQTVTVEAGETFEVRPRQPAHDFAVGASAPDVQKMEEELRELREKLAAAEKALAERTPKPPAPAPAPPAPKCNADEPSERGREAFAQGSYSEALRHFEEAIACSPQPLLQQKAFVVACNLRDIAKAAAFWARLPQALRMQVVNVCVRNGITEEDLEGAAVKTGTLAITTSPAARVLVDGKELGTSPLTIEVPPGRHKVTLMVGADKYTYATTVRAGETVTLHKQLGNP